MIFEPIFLRYVFTGLILNGVGFVSFIILLQYFHFSPIMSISIQYPIIICIYYLTQTYFVFNKKANLEASFKFKPMNNAAVIAVPDLDAPGKSEKT